MALSHHRPKRPDEVKERLLVSAMNILVDRGMQSVTLDAVSRQAGVSKGALIHHFKNRDGLLNGLSDYLLGLFHRRLNSELEQEAPGPHRLQRAYIRTAFHDQSPRSAKATGLMAMLWPPCADRCRQIQQDIWSGIGQPETGHDIQLLAMFAAEGIWFAAIRGHLDLDAQQQERLMRALLSRL
jgi:AcrR family transcriptional regulator